MRDHQAASVLGNEDGARFAGERRRFDLLSRRERVASELAAPIGNDEELTIAGKREGEWLLRSLDTQPLGERAFGHVLDARQGEGLDKVCIADCDPDRAVITDDD